jgi:hypothetical protein
MGFDGVFTEWHGGRRNDHIAHDHGADKQRPIKEQIEKVFPV